MKYTDREFHSGYECSRSLIQLNHVAYKVGTSRYQVHARRRQTQRSLKVASLRDPVRIAYPAIASAGNAQTQCPTQRRIQNTLGPWMRVHPQGMLAAEIGLSISLSSQSVLFGVNSLDLDLAPQRKSARCRCSRDDKVRHVSSVLLRNQRAAPLPCGPSRERPSTRNVGHQRPHPVHRCVRVLRRKHRRGRDHARLSW